MAIGAQDLELIKQEVAGIREFYESRMDQEVTPLKEEIGRIEVQLNRVRDMWREGEKRAILSTYGGADRLRVPYGKYNGLDHLDLACIRSLLTAQLREPTGLNPRMLSDWQTNIKAAMDSTTAGSGDELVDTQEARAMWEDVNLETAIAPLFPTVQMPSNPFQIPLRLGDVNWYPGVENVANKSTSLATARQTLTAYELVAEVPWSYDLDEDAVIAMMEELRRHLMTNAYAGLTTLKSTGALNITGAGFDDRLLAMLEEVSRWIDGYCNRHFYVLTTARRFDGGNSKALNVPDLIALTSLKTDEDNDRTYELTWAASDYLLYPLNAEPQQPWGRPYTRTNPGGY